MKKKAYLLPCACFLFLIACQRETSFEAGQSSAGSLLKNAAGDCEPITATGTFTAAKPVTDSNVLTVRVNVSAKGPYLITTDTVNGYSFKATGTFGATGVTTVQLKAAGKPLVAGIDDFTVRYDSSLCYADVTVSRSLADPAVFSLAGSPGPCANAVVQGSFVNGYPLDTASKVTLQVVVTTPGAYSLSTGTVNGYGFTGSGTFAAAGTQTVALRASGTPATAGTNSFSVAGAPAGCSFNVAVTSPLVVTNTDYFPLTQSSFWVYSRDDFAVDSVKRTVVDSVTQNGQPYKKIDEYFPFAGGPLYFRKTGTGYFEWGRVDKYTTSFQYGGSGVTGDIPFLRENLTTGVSWMSPEYTGTASFGQAIWLRYRFECMDANAAVTLNGITFGNVYKIRMLPEIASVVGQWGSTNEAYQFYYAKGVGLILATKNLNAFTQYVQSLRRWRVY